MQMIEKPHVVAIDQTGMNSVKTSGSTINIYDCLNTFSTDETLRGDDKWYCGKCKDHVVAHKKMEIFKSPDYLLIHLKRFSHTRNQMFGSRKLNDYIEFPAEGLDMTNYCAESRDGPKGKKMVYDLYGVSNHFGSMGGGHYTAYCKNPVYKKWYDFDDSDVSRINQSNLCTKAAYVLFYKLRK